MSSKSIFEVDVKGLRQLQEGKPKWFIIRELLQNAMDEPVNSIKVFMAYHGGNAHITVVDDSPIGFRNLADAYTLFADTYKREKADKRGRFNFGEKQVLCMCDHAKITSTTGCIYFDIKKNLREKRNEKRENGSEVWVSVKMKKDEYNECIEYLKLIKPGNIHIMVFHGEHETRMDIPHVVEHKSFVCKLLTELKVEDSMKRVQRDTPVFLYKEETSYLYEMGIPVCEIDCGYSIDVQQRVPLSNDRDSVPVSYLRTLYGEVLNETYAEVTKETASNQWVREATMSDRVEAEAVKTVITQRFGDKALIANPFDRRSMDEAISNNFNVIYSSELNKDEWDKIKGFGILQSTSEMFKTGIAEGRMVAHDQITPYQQWAGELAKKIASDILRIHNLQVKFFESPDATVLADYHAESATLRFNLSHLDIEWWRPVNGMVSQKMLDLIIHELGHSEGMHYEHRYHDCLTLLGSSLTLLAIKNPTYFKF